MGEGLGDCVVCAVCVDDCAGGHDLLDIDLAEGDEVADYAEFEVVDDAFVVGEFGEVADFLAGDPGCGLFAGEEFGDPVADGDDGFEDQDEPVDRDGGKWGEGFGVYGSYGFGDNF